MHIELLYYGERRMKKKPLIEACVACDKDLHSDEQIYMQEKYKDFALCKRCYEEFKAVKANRRVAG